MLLNGACCLLLTAALGVAQGLNLMVSPATQGESTMRTTSARSSGQCGYQTSDLEGTISIPENQYRSASCVWNITVPAGHKIHLHITKFYTQGNVGSCHYSWLIINGISAENNTQIHSKLCGSKAVPGNFSLLNHANIEYYHNGNGQAYFTLVYRSVAENISEITKNWISDNQEILLAHKESLPRALPALSLFDESFFSKNNITGYKFKTEYMLKLSADLLRNSTRTLHASDLAHHVFALISICSNPRSFHGIDLVHHLRNFVKKDPSSANPFDLLTLCSAGENLTSSDIQSLGRFLETEKPNIYMLDFRAIAVMTLICAKEQNKELPVYENLQKAVEALTSYQRKDGSFGSLRSTVLIFQALSAAGALERSWNKTSALKFVQSRNDTNGSFGNICNLYTVLPTLREKTLLDINIRKCNFSPDGVSPLEEIEDKMDKLISLTYQLWIGDEGDTRYTIYLKFPNGTRFFDVMRLAAEKDRKFQLKWTFVKNDLYVYEIAGCGNDPTGGKYWNLYTFNNASQPVLFEKRLEEFTPEDGDTAVMWYKTVKLHQ